MRLSRRWSAIGWRSRPAALLATALRLHPPPPAPLRAHASVLQLSAVRHAGKHARHMSDIVLSELLPDRDPPADDEPRQLTMTIKAIQSSAALLALVGDHAGSASWNFIHVASCW